MIADDLRVRRELEAVAFGRVDTPEDEAAAARALQALQALRELDDRAASMAPEPVNVMPVNVEAVDDPDGMSHGAPSGIPNRVTKSLRRFWVVPVVVASIALGAVAGWVATRAAEKPPVSSVGQATVPPDAGSTSDTISVAGPTLPPSDADGTSAEDWLNQPRQPMDIFPDEPGLLAFGVDPNSTHVVTTEGATSVWIARGSASSLCLVLVATVDGSFQVRCTPPELYAEKGVSAEAADGTTAHWSGGGVTVSVAGSTG
jgi:hypothetical protein